MNKHEDFTSSMAFVKKYVDQCVQEVKDELDKVVMPEGMKLIIAEDKRIHVTISLPILGETNV
jgi:hypothetical protein